MTDPKVMAHAIEAEKKSKGSVGDGNLAEPIEMEEFFEGIAAIYDLPEREVEAPPPPVVVPPAERRRLRKRERNLLAAAGVLCMGLLGFGLFRKATVGAIPPALVGEWVTSDAKYAGRAFVINGKTVGFQTGPEAGNQAYPISSVEQITGPGDTLHFTVAYKANGGDLTWAFDYTWVPEPTIRFANQKNMLWTLKR